jgi:hypothetical protein
MRNRNPTFQHRHYARIASMLSPTVDKFDRDALIAEFADMFAADNDRFDRERFLAACYGNPTRKDRRSGERQRGLPLSP